jgi:hypothetical protein
MSNALSTSRTIVPEHSLAVFGSTIGDECPMALVTFVIAVCKRRETTSMMSESSPFFRKKRGRKLHVVINRSIVVD